MSRVSLVGSHCWRDGGGDSGAHSSGGGGGFRSLVLVEEVLGLRDRNVR